MRDLRTTTRVVATAGHVDHGKSSLVRALTGTDPDRLAEERRRGLTIELGFAHTTLPSGATVSIVDVPGHVRFLRNMLAGVGAVDACVFVVAGTERWKPQSEEHLRILELLGIGHGIVALTKTDIIDATALAAAREEVRMHLAGSFLADAPIVDVGVPDGAWVTGRAELLAALDDLVAHVPAAPDVGRARLWIDRVFAKAGSGTVVTGTLTGGAVAVGDALDVHPGGHAVRVRGLQSLGVPVDDIGPGHRVALNLAGVEHRQLARGGALVAPGRWHVTERVDASLSVLDALDHDVSRRGAYVAYIGSGEHPVALRVLGPEALAPGEDGLVRLHLPVGLPLVPGDRYVLRESGRDETVGGGEVLDVAPVLPASRARPDRRVERVVAERAWVGVDELARLTGVVATPTLGPWVVDPAALDDARRQLLDDVDRAGPAGLDVAGLGDRQRLLATSMDELHVDGTRVRRAGAVREEHPVVELLRRGGLAPPDIPDVARHELRDLERRGVLFERDGRWFHVDALEIAGRLAASLLVETPGGFGVSQFREAAGITRKHAVPLVSELDARAFTRRRGDVHIGGPRLPSSG